MNQTDAYAVLYELDGRMFLGPERKTEKCAEMSVHPFEGATVRGVVALLPEPMLGREFAERRVIPDVSLIAELGQEVGAEQAPAWFYVRTPGADYDYTFTKTREEAIDLQDCDEPDEPIPLYTSPAHTSEARDAVVGEVVEIGDDDEGQPRILIHTTREAIKNGPPLAFRTVSVAAMRQEGGNG